MKDIINTYTYLFREYGFNRPSGAASYYALLIDKFPTPFAAIENEYINLFQDDARPFDVRQGKLELYEKGFVARVLFNDSKADLENEQLIPVHPKRIWEEMRPQISQNNPLLNIQVLDNQVDILTEKFRKFGDLGIYIDNGSLTLMYGKRWFYEFLVNNLDGISNLYIMLSALGSFEEPHLEYYRKMLKNRSLKIQALYDEKALKDNKTETLNIFKLLEDYSDQFFLKFTPITHVTSRRVLSNKFAIDARKLLPDNRPDTTYIGTIYLQKDVIQFLENNFKSSWVLAKEHSNSKKKEVKDNTKPYENKNRKKS